MSLHESDTSRKSLAGAENSGPWNVEILIYIMQQVLSTLKVGRVLSDAVPFARRLSNAQLTR